jgi:hypothetical protein
MIKKRKIVKAGSEASEQIAIINYLKAQYPNALYCASAGGLKTSYTQAARMKMMGYKRGFPDLQICEPIGQYHGLFIEMKKEDGYPSPEQKVWVSELEKRGYRALVCKGFEAAKKAIDDYFTGGQ